MWSNKSHVTVYWSSYTRESKSKTKNIGFVLTLHKKERPSPVLLTPNHQITRHEKNTNPHRTTSFLVPFGEHGVNGCAHITQRPTEKSNATASLTFFFNRDTKTKKRMTKTRETNEAKTQQTQEKQNIKKQNIKNRAHQKHNEKDEKTESSKLYKNTKQSENKTKQNKTRIMHPRTQVIQLPEPAWVTTRQTRNPKTPK